MFTYLDWIYHLEHYKDLLREAENERLARLARPTHKVVKKTMIHINPQPNFPAAACCQTTACCQAEIS